MPIRFVLAPEMVIAGEFDLNGAQDMLDVARRMNESRDMPPSLRGEAQRYALKFLQRDPGANYESAFLTATPLDSSFLQSAPNSIGIIIGMRPGQTAWKHWMLFYKSAEHLLVALKASETLVHAWQEGWRALLLLFVLVVGLAWVVKTRGKQSKLAHVIIVLAVVAYLLGADGYAKMKEEQLPFAMEVTGWQNKTT